MFKLKPQKKKINLIVLILIFPLVCVSKQPNDVIKTKFLALTEFVLGDYTLISGSESCQEGDLYILEVKNDFSLMLGAKALAMGLSSNKLSKDEENGCKISWETKVGSQKVVFIETYKCEKSLIKNQVSINKTREGLNYTRDVYSNGKLTQKELCVLKLEQINLK